jgi:trk system potassium uptake protein
MDLRPVLFILGLLLCITAAGMVLPMAADLAVGHPDWQVFAACIAVTGFFGAGFFLTNMGAFVATNLSVRQVFVLTTLTWVAMGLFGALPFMFCELDLPFADAVFESVSGITTTGSTVIVGLDTAPPGILLWRAILQWLGGVGVILMAMSVLPLLNVGGMQIFRAELSESEKALPRTAALASSIGLIYVGLTAVCAASYGAAGMSRFDAVAHALTTLSTGGFSTFDASFGGHSGPWAEIVAIVFMITGSLPFVLYLKAARGDAAPLLRDAQVRAFVGIVVAAIVAITLYLSVQQGMAPAEALRRGAFNVVSLITGTGFVSEDYSTWGGFPAGLLFFLMFMGGCAGSTTCGIKIFRFQVLWAVSISQIRQLLYPHGVFVAQYNGRPLGSDVPLSVMSFFFLYILCFVFLAVALSLVGLDFITAMSGAATAISNVGPGLGPIIGPVGTFAPLPESAKWLLCVGMVLGRLEIFTVLVLFVPRFWRR